MASAVLAAVIASPADTTTVAMSAGLGVPRAVAMANYEFVGLRAGIPRPAGIAISPDGRVTVTDQTTQIAKSFLPSGEERTLRPAPRASDEEAASAPFGVAVDEAGRIFVSDPARREVLAYASGDTRSSPFAGPAWEGRTPGVMFARNGRLYVADLARQQIVVLDIEDEREIAVLGSGEGGGVGQLRFPNGIWVDGSGVVFVSDTNNDRIQRFAPDGSPLSAWYGTFQNPRGLAGDDSGRLYVANTLAHEILVLDSGGNAVARLDRAGPRDLGFPTGLAVFGNRLLVTDRDAHGVLEWQLPDERPPR